MDEHFCRLLITIYKWYHKMLTCFQRYKSNACSKLRHLLVVGGVINRLHCIAGGRGGGVGSPKKDYVIF